MKVGGELGNRTLNFCLQNRRVPVDTRTPKLVAQRRLELPVEDYESPVLPITLPRNTFIIEFMNKGQSLRQTSLYSKILRTSHAFVINMRYPDTIL